MKIVKNSLIDKFVKALFVVIITANNVFAADSTPQEIKSLIAKFAVVMVGLFLFSFILYIGLSIYNRFFVDKKIKDISLRKISLASPKDIDEAVMMFIDKNRLQ